MVIGNMRDAAAAAPPELDQPGTRDTSHGLRASASQLYCPGAGACVPIIALVPTMIAPAARKRAMPRSSNRAVRSGPPTMFITGMPATATCSFTEIGMPCRGPSVSPRLAARSGGVEIFERLELGLEFLDPPEEVVDHFDRRDLTGADQLAHAPCR